MKVKGLVTDTFDDAQCRLHDYLVKLRTFLAKSAGAWGKGEPTAEELDEASVMIQVGMEHKLGMTELIKRSKIELKSA